MNDISRLKSFLINTYKELFDYSGFVVTFSSHVIVPFITIETRAYGSNSENLFDTKYKRARLVFEDDGLQKWITLGINNLSKDPLSREVRLLTLEDGDLGLFPGSYMPGVKERLIKEARRFRKREDSLLELYCDGRLFTMGEPIGERRDLSPRYWAERIMEGIKNPPKLEVSKDVKDPVLVE